MDPRAYPTRGGVSRESGGSPLRGQHRWVHPNFGGVIPRHLRQFDKLSVRAHIADAMPTISAGPNRRISEQLQPAFGEQPAGQRIGLWVRDWYARGDPIHDRPVRRATVALV